LFSLALSPGLFLVLGLSTWRSASLCTMDADQQLLVMSASVRVFVQVCVYKCALASVYVCVCVSYPQNMPLFMSFKSFYDSLYSFDVHIFIYFYCRQAVPRFILCVCQCLCATNPTESDLFNSDLCDYQMWY
jgi:hypothetical protein